jgi:class 3 adenylate cyclase
VAWFLLHVVAYAAVNALLVGVWVTTSGSTDELRAVWQDPVNGVVDHDFWPIWVIASWGALVVIHAGSVLAFGLFGRRAGQRRRRMARAARRAAFDHQKWVHDIATRWKSGSMHIPPAERRPWVAVMFTDVIESTELAEKLGDEEWGRMLAAHRQLVREQLARHQGHEVGTQGDGFLIRFGSPEHAVACAIGIQQAVEAGAARGDAVLFVRIGVHAGQAVADGDDLVGRVINLAYRVTALATTGEILVTEPVADELSTSVPLADRGLVSLKGIARPRHLLSVEWRSATEPLSAVETE